MESLLKKIYSAQRLYKTLLILSKIIVLLTVPAFALTVWHGYTVSPLSAVKICVVCGVPFVIVTAVRRILNSPRPYELYSFYDRAPKKKQGCSFPSRHAFSVFVVGSVMCFAYPILGAAVLALGIILSVLRVLTGIHFIRDVVTGTLIGVISGVVGVIFTSPFV